ncbi:MAG TPA: biotin--[acetyl-CoA-carboxylase] ligase [Gemmatimonadales bacterium]|nr:biotin--[acetyl-CoA-carboxylase] ligase [Gemmatimonadales bacterium]
MSEVPLIRHESLGSTQDEAHRLATEGAAHGTAVTARVQTGGRGTRGRPWVSGDGGLWLSVVCRPGPGAAPEVVGLRVGLALAEYLDRFLFPPHRIVLKWPNDLFLGERKVGGVLAEARWQGAVLGWMVIGVGINFQNDIPPDLGDTATRLFDAGVNADPASLAEAVAAVVADAARDASPLTQAEVAAFESRDWLRGRALSLPEPGIAEGITAAGRLRVRDELGVITEILSPVTLRRPV